MDPNSQASSAVGAQAVSAVSQGCLPQCTGDRIAEPAVPIVVYQCRRMRLFGDVAPLQARHPVLQLPDQPGSTDR
jgi:hypothetical protein